MTEALIQVKFMNSYLQSNYGEITKCPICGNEMESGFAMLSSGSYLRWYKEAKDLHRVYPTGRRSDALWRLRTQAHVP